MRIPATLLLLIICQAATAQKFIDSKLKTSLLYGIAKGSGSTLYKDDSYVAPSLMNNFQSGFTIGITTSYKFRKLWTANLGIKKSDFSNWSYDKSSRFEGAQLSILSFAPQIGIITPFKENGFFNRITLSAFAGPSLNISSLNLAKVVFSAAPSTNYNFLKSSSSSYGIDAGADVKINVGHKSFIGFSYNYSYQWVSSLQFESSAIALNAINFHVGVLLKNNKRYKYAPQWFE